MRLRLGLKHVVGFSLVVMVFGVYVFSLTSIPSGYADSDELLTTGSLFGVSHPSGYPMAVLVSGVVLNVTHGFVSAALAGNLLAAVLHSLTALVLYYSLYELFSIFFGKEIASWNYIVSTAAASVLLAFSSMFWLWGVKLEVVAFTSFLVSLTIYASIQWYQRISTGSNSSFWFYATWVLAGIGLAHVHIFLLILPCLLLLIGISFPIWKNIDSYQRIRTWVLGLLSFGVAFVLINSLLLVFNALKADFSWYFPQSIQGWIHLIARQDYSGYFIELDRDTGAYLAEFSPKAFLKAIPYYLRFLGDHISLIGLVLLVVGSGYIVTLKDRFKWYVLSLFVFMGILFGARLGYLPRDPGFEPFLDIGVMHRQYTAGEYAGFILVGFGLVAIFSFVSRKIPNSLAQVISLLIVGLLIAGQVAVQTPIGVQHGNDFAYRYAKSMLEMADPNSVIICSSDISCYTLFYLSELEEMRPDVVILTKNDKYRRHFLDSQPEYYPAVFEENPNFYAELIAFNMQRGPVYLTNITDFYKNYIGLEGNPFFLVPKGYMYQIVTDPTTSNPIPPPTDLAADLVSYPFAYQDFFGRGLRHYFGDLHRSLGTLLSYYGLKNDATTHLEVAATLYPEVQLTFDQLEYMPLYAGEDIYKQPSATTSATLIANAELEEELGQFENAYNLLVKAAVFDPFDSQVRLSQARLLMAGGYAAEASLQLRQILQNDPDHATAAAVLNRFEMNLE